MLISYCSIATHNTGGSISYKHLQGLTYEVTIVTFTKTSSPADRPELELQWSGGISTVPRFLIEILSGDRQVNYYRDTISFGFQGTQILLVEDPNRNSGILNIPGSVNVPFAIQSTILISPFVSNLNSVYFPNPPLLHAEAGTLHRQNITALDLDADELRYELIESLGEDGLPIPGYTFPPNMTLDPVSGELVWMTPATIGEYTITVKVSEYQSGTYVGEVIRDFSIVVNNDQCDNGYTNTSTWPTNVNGDFLFLINPGDTLQLNPVLDVGTSGVDTLECHSELLIGSGSAQCTTSQNGPDWDGDFFWVPGSADQRTYPYVIVFRARDTQGVNGCEEDLTIQVFVGHVPTTIDETNIINARVWPNPANNTFQLEVGPEAIGGTLYLMNSKGQMVKEDISITNRKETIEISDLAPGIYFWKLTKGQKINISGCIVRQ